MRSTLWIALFTAFLFASEGARGLAADSTSALACPSKGGLVVYLKSKVKSLLPKKRLLSRKETRKQLPAADPNPVLYDSSQQALSPNGDPYRSNPHIIINATPPKTPLNQVRVGYAYRLFARQNYEDGVVRSVDLTNTGRIVIERFNKKNHYSLHKEAPGAAAIPIYFADESGVNRTEFARLKEEVFYSPEKNRIVRAGEYYTFSSSDHSSFFPGILQGYDPDGNIVLKTDSGATLVLDANKLDMRNIRTGRSFAPLHDYSMGSGNPSDAGKKAYVLFHFKDERTSTEVYKQDRSGREQPFRSNTLYRIDGFTKDGKIIAIPVFEKNVSVDRKDKGLDCLFNGKPFKVGSAINVSNSIQRGNYEVYADQWLTGTETAQPVYLNPDEIREFVAVEFSYSDRSFRPSNRWPQK